MPMVPQAVRKRLEKPVFKLNQKEAASDCSDEPPPLQRTQCSCSAPADHPASLPVSPFLLARRLPRQGERTRLFRRTWFPGATDSQWRDWRWQMCHRIESLEQLERLCELSESERLALTQGGSLLPSAVTPYYMSLIDPRDPRQPLRRTLIPDLGEFLRTGGESDDPLDEDRHSPVPGLVHRYPDRALFLVHDSCATFCRYCTRTRVVGQDELTPDRDRLQAGLDYLRRHAEVRDVLLSGGDPLILSDEKLDWLLGELRAIPHLQILRIGTKVPVVLPQRITPRLVRMLRRHQPLFLSIHFTHPDECTPETALACRRLADGGLPLGSQTVLLKGVNDDLGVMRLLMHSLLLMRVRPYYLYQCDPISGSAHFRTSVERGLEIIHGLRGWTSGYAVPTYVIDAPGGGGKIPLQPDYLAGRDGDDLLLRSFTGEVHRYSDPQSCLEVAR